MKKSILLTIFFTLTLIQGQQFISKIEVVYRFDWQRDSTNVNARVIDDMSLFIGEKQSLLIPTNKEKNDSIIKNFKYIPGTVIDSKNLPTSKFNFIIYKNYTDRKIIYIEPLGNIKIGYEDKFNSSLWVIKNEKKTIIGYQCQKATIKFRGRSYTAWFTTEIPISDGPYKFCGLPGLILNLSDDKGQFNFETVKISTKEKKVTSDTTFEKINRSELYPKKIAFISSLRSNIPADLTSKKPQLIYNPIEKE